jgi:hypothetical protein
MHFNFWQSGPFGVGFGVGVGLGAGSGGADGSLGSADAVSEPSGTAGVTSVPTGGCESIDGGTVPQLASAKLRAAETISTRSAGRSLDTEELYAMQTNPWALLAA